MDLQNILKTRSPVNRVSPEHQVSTSRCIYIYYNRGKISLSTKSYFEISFSRYKDNDIRNTPLWHIMSLMVFKTKVVAYLCQHVADRSDTERVMNSRVHVAHVLYITRTYQAHILYFVCFIFFSDTPVLKWVYTMLHTNVFVSSLHNWKTGQPNI